MANHKKPEVDDADVPWTTSDSACPESVRLATCSANARKKPSC